MDIVSFFLGIIFVTLVVCITIACVAIRSTQHQHSDPVERIADLQSWEFLRSLSRDGHK